MWDYFIYSTIIKFKKIFIYKWFFINLCSNHLFSFIIAYIRYIKFFLPKKLILNKKKILAKLILKSCNKTKIIQKKLIALAKKIKLKIIKYKILEKINEYW